MSQIAAGRRAKIFCPASAIQWPFLLVLASSRNQQVPVFICSLDTVFRLFPVVFTADTQGHPLPAFSALAPLHHTKHTMPGESSVICPRHTAANCVQEEKTGIKRTSTECVVFSSSCCFASSVCSRLICVVICTDYTCRYRRFIRDLYTVRTCKIHTYIHIYIYTRNYMYNGFIQPRRVRFFSTPVLIISYDCQFGPGEK